MRAMDVGSRKSFVNPGGSTDDAELEQDLADMPYGPEWLDKEWAAREMTGEPSADTQELYRGLEVQRQQSLKKVKQFRWRERRTALLDGLAGLAWMVFCAAGAAALVGHDHPWLVTLLGTSVWLLGIYLALRAFGQIGRR